MKKRTDTEIHYSDLLITLDYLLTNTDEGHPATQQKILEYAKEKYGLKYDKDATGNDIRRQSVAKCLKFLDDISTNHPEYFPFVLQKTDSGKYYIEERHGLNETQVAKILAAISNDKYAEDEDDEFLRKRILEAFSTSNENEDIITTEYQHLLKGVKKLDKDTIKKINLFEQAYREGKMIKVVRGTGSSSYCAWYRVYMIEEFKSKLHAFMLPIGPVISPEAPKTVNGYIFEPIEEINISKEKPVLFNDEPDRNFDDLFRQTCPALAKKYHDLGYMLEQTILPNDGKTCIVSFYFDLHDKDIIKRSFEKFFSKSFRYQETNSIAGVEKTVKNILPGMDNWTIVTDEPKKNEVPQKGLANISVDNNSFKSWLLSDPYGSGDECIADIVSLIKPASLKRDIAYYFYNKLYYRINDLNFFDKQDFVNLGKRVKMKIDYSQETIFPKLDEAYEKSETLHLNGPSYPTSSIVSKWFDKNKDKVHGYYLFGGLQKTFFDETNTVLGTTVKGQLFASNEIDNFASLPNRVIAIDDYQFLDDNCKKHIALLEKGYVIDSREKSGYKQLKNIRFVCIIEDKDEC